MLPFIYESLPSHLLRFGALALNHSSIFSTKGILRNDYVIKPKSNRACAIREQCLAGICKISCCAERRAER